MITRVAAFAIATAVAGTSHAATVVDFVARRWTAAEGGDGRLRALVVVDAPWSWDDANTLATALGATLARADSPAELGFLAMLADHPGAFDCAGPWLGGFRQPQSSWIWTSSGTAVPSFGWAPLRPAQSVRFPSALLLSGVDAPDGRWIDVLPDADAGVGTHAALLAWTSFEDCDGDDVPDLLEISRLPSLDADHDGRLDACSPTNPADINRDGHVDALDLARLLGAWGTADASADIDRNGTVSASDLGALLAAWG